MLFALLGAQAAFAQQPRGATPPPVFTHDLPDLDLRGWSVTAVEVKYAPGQASNAHRHPGLTPARLLAILLAEKGKPLTSPA